MSSRSYTRNPPHFTALFLALALALLSVTLVTALPVRAGNQAVADYNDLASISTHSDPGTRYGTGSRHGWWFGMVTGNNYPTAHGVGERKTLSLLSTGTERSASVPAEPHHNAAGLTTPHIDIERRLIKEWQHQSAPPRPPPPPAPVVFDAQTQKKIDRQEGKALTHNDKAMYHFGKMLAHDAAHPKYQHHSQKMDAHLAKAEKHAAVADHIRQQHGG